MWNNCVYLTRKEEDFFSILKFFAKFLWLRLGLSQFGSVLICNARVFFPVNFVVRCSGLGCDFVFKSMFLTYLDWIQNSSLRLPSIFPSKYLLTYPDSSDVCPNTPPISLWQSCTALCRRGKGEKGESSLKLHFSGCSFPLLAAELSWIPLLVARWGQMLDCIVHEFKTEAQRATWKLFKYVRSPGSEGPLSRS